MFVGQVCFGLLFRLRTGPVCGEPEGSGEVGGVAGDSTAISVAMGTAISTSPADGAAGMQALLQHPSGAALETPAVPGSVTFLVCRKRGWSRDLGVQ